MWFPAGLYCSANRGRLAAPTGGGTRYDSETYWGADWQRIAAQIGRVLRIWAWASGRRPEPGTDGGEGFARRGGTVLDGALPVRLGVCRSLMARRAAEGGMRVRRESTWNLGAVCALRRSCTLRSVSTRGRESGTSRGKKGQQARARRYPRDKSR